jgi:hypothetical protein
MFACRLMDFTSKSVLKNNIFWIMHMADCIHNFPRICFEEKWTFVNPLWLNSLIASKFQQCNCFPYIYGASSLNHIASSQFICYLLTTFSLNSLVLWDYFSVQTYTLYKTKKENHFIKMFFNFYSVHIVINFYSRVFV